MRNSRDVLGRPEPASITTVSMNDTGRTSLLQFNALPCPLPVILQKFELAGLNFCKITAKRGPERAVLAHARQTVVMRLNV